MVNGKNNVVAPARYTTPAKVTPIKENANDTSNELDDQDIIYSDIKNNDHKSNIPYYYGLLGLLGLIIGLMLSSLIVLIPQSDVIEHSDHWYKFSLLYSILSGFGISVNFGLIQPSYWMEINFLRNWKPFLSRFSIMSVSLFVSNALCYVVWTTWWKQKHPMPLNYFLCNSLSFWIMQGTLWIHIPKLEKKKSMESYRKFLLSQIVINGCFLGYSGMGYALDNMCIDYQWILAIFFALIRELNQKILSRVCCQISKGNQQWIKISAWHWMAAVNSFFLTVAISSVATVATSYLMLTIDFLVNMYLCFQIIWKCRKNNNALNEEIMLHLNELVLNEKLEAVIPVGYCLCYLMAYYGPNKTILGNVAESDVEKTMQMTGLLFLLDVSSLLVSSTFLWVFCKINLFKVYLKSQKKLWWIMASQEAYLLYEVSISSLLESCYGFVFSIYMYYF